MKDSNLPSFNKRSFMANFEGMENLAYEAIQNFLSTLPSLIHDIERAIQSNNPSNLQTAAHTLKGAVSNFHAKPSELLALSLEIMGQNNNFINASATFAELKAELKVLELELQNVTRTI